MSGTPVWLASLSRRSSVTGEPIPTGRWSPRDRADAEATLRRVLGGVGDARRERLFRMNVTLCLHRAVNDEEWVALPSAFHETRAVGFAAGAPIEVLWESEPGSPSTRPCAAPQQHRLGFRDPDLWLPVDCGRCGPCLARAETMTGPVIPIEQGAA